MKIKFLEAFNGDSIWISFLENETSRNIIIDGGIGDTYKNQLRRGGELFNAIEYLKENSQHIDLLILTHFDDDHIGGILKWLNDDKDAPKLIKNVWFNSGKAIANELQTQENNDLNIEIQEIDENCYYTGLGQGIRFENYLLKHNLWDSRIIRQGDKHELYGLTFKILSPNNDNLKKLLELYKKDTDYFTGGGEYDFSKILNDFIDEENQPKFRFEEDKSVANGSSIAFIMEYQDKKFLFLGDAHPSVVIEGLKHFNIDENNKVSIELMKVSHHGSKYNTNEELLDLIKTNNFIISSDGAKHGLPNKRTIARIIKTNPMAIIHFNYGYLKDNIFTEDDFDTHKYFKISSTNEFDY